MSTLLERERVRPGDAPPRGWRRPAVVRLLPASLLLVLGTVTLITDPPLWYDEEYTRLAAGVPLTTLLSGIWHRTGVTSYLMDVPPSFNGPYYVVMHLWCSVVGTSDLALRLPSLLCAVGAVAVLAELGRRLAGPGAGLLAGALAATGPLMLDEVTQARDYGPGLLAVAVCALCLHEWIRTGRGLRRVALAALAAGLMHWFTLPVLAGFGLAALIHRPGRDGRRAAIVLGGSCLPAVLLIGWSLAGGTYGAPTPVAVGLRLPVQAVEDWGTGSVVLALALTGCALTAVLRSRHRVLLGCWAVVPLVLVTAVELWRPTYYPRYLLFTLLGLVLAAGVGVATWRSRRLRLAVGSLLVALSLAVTVPHLTDGAREPAPAAVALLAAEQTAGEPIIPADGRTSLDLETYLAGAPRLAEDLVLPPVLFTDQTSSPTVWLVRVVLQQNSLPIVPAEQRLIDAGWTETGSTLLVGGTTNLRVEQWTR